MYVTLLTLTYLRRGLGSNSIILFYKCDLIKKKYCNVCNTLTYLHRTFTHKTYIYTHTREIDLAQQYNIPPLFSKKEKEKEKGTSQFNDFV